MRTSMAGVVGQSVKRVEDQRILTGRGHYVDDLQLPRMLHAAFLRSPIAHGLQCGFCTPGILMTMSAFLEENPDPTEEEVRHALSGNLCRCTGYQHVVDAVLLAARRILGDRPR